MASRKKKETGTKNLCSGKKYQMKIEARAKRNGSTMSPTQFAS
jgi:hypothetical protein